MGWFWKKRWSLVSDEFDFAIHWLSPSIRCIDDQCFGRLWSCLLWPVQTEFYALKGLSVFMHPSGIRQKSLTIRFFAFTIVPTMYEGGLMQRTESYKNLKATYGDGVWPGVIPVELLVFRGCQSGADSSFSVLCQIKRGVRLCKLP